MLEVMKSSHLSCKMVVPADSSNMRDAIITHPGIIPSKNLFADVFRISRLVVSRDAPSRFRVECKADACSRLSAIQQTRRLRTLRPTTIQSSVSQEHWSPVCVRSRSHFCDLQFVKCTKSASYFKKD